MAIWGCFCEKFVYICNRMKNFICLICVVFMLGACGSPRTAIRVTNKADGTDTRITVSQGDGGSTSVTVNPSVNAALDSINFSIR